MDKSDIVVLLVTIISATAAFASQRAAARATSKDKLVSSRADLETEAYTRARAIDTETIERQTNELKEMRVEIADLRTKCETTEDKYDLLVDQNRRLRERIVDLERHERGTDVEH